LKLKLEIQEGVTILVVTEDVTNQHFAILKAGLLKLFQSGKKSILLDLIGVTQMTPDVMREITVLQQLAPEMDGQLMIASLLGESGHAATREEAIRQMNTTLYGLLGTEARLQARLRRLERARADLSAKVGASGTMDAEIRGLKRENSDLKRIIRDLEAHVRTLVASRGEPPEGGPTIEKVDSIKKTLTAVLEQEGVLPVT
jgi:hypothetical protein